MSTVPITILSFCAAGFAIVLAGLVLVRDRRSFANRIFAVGMLALAAHEVASAFGSRALLPSDAIEWQRLRVSIGALVPGTWLLFSLSFGRANYEHYLKKWRWAVVSIFALPLLLIGGGWDSLFTEALLSEPSRWVLALGWAGYALYLFFLLGAVLILMNLESTLRASTGTVRWQIKFTLLGVGAFFAVQIYTCSQTLLYSTWSPTIASVNSAGLVVASALILVSIFRSRLIPADVYLSESLLYNSLTILVAGIYLLAVGGLAKVVSVLGGSQSLPLAAFLVFVALLALAILLVSGEAQQRLKLFINRHLQRPQHDYRKVWSTFSKRTGSILEIRTLCSSIATMVSETFGVPAVNIWLLNESQDALSLGGSTALSEERGEALLSSSAARGSSVIQGMQQLADATTPSNGDPHEAEPLDPIFLSEAQIRHCVPLVGAGERLGYLTLSERVTKEPLTTEDLDLLKTIGDQAGAALLNLNLSERLVRAKEMEAFQSLAAFFVHDLKNLASRLSLTMQNLPDNYENPSFREDMLQVMAQSVQKMNSMCSRLSPLSRQLDLNRIETDLNDLVTTTLKSLNGSLGASLAEELHPVHTLLIDPEQIQKVLVNLVLNANEATGERGEVRVVTRERNGWAELSVTDNGCGMSRDFMARSLFKPFQTTKKQGLGIGLFHSKKIVEAHHGRLEVESQEGKGSTFRVMLPETKDLRV